MNGRRRASGRDLQWIALAAVGAMVIATTAAYAKHGGGLALPIIGGLAGGGLLTSAIYQQHEIGQLQKGDGNEGTAVVSAPQYIYVPAQPVYAAPPPAYPAYDSGSNYASIQGRLQELDNLCAQRLVPPNQCAERRQQILNGL